MVELRQVCCARDGAVLRHVSLQFASGSFNVFIGDAGSGLLLRLASLLEPPEAGEVLLLGHPTRALDEPGRTMLRSRQIGFLFASPCLLPGLSVVENVAMPLFKVLDLDPTDAAQRSARALAFVDFQSHEREDVDQLSRFDQQRVALARAIAHAPALIVLERADANLNAEEAVQLHELVRRAREQLGVTVLTTFASEPVTRHSDRVLAVEGGLVCRDSNSAPQCASGQPTVS